MSGALRRIALIASAGAAICACGADTEPGAQMGPSGLPHPRAGLWRWASGAAGVRQLCFSGQVLTVLAPRPGCTALRQVMTRDGAFVVEAHCAAGPVRRIYAKAWGDFDRAFFTNVTVGDASDHAEYHYIGPCRPGQKPDDAP